VLKVFLINSLVIAVTVMIHYEFLYRFTNLMPKLAIRHRFRIVFGVFGALIAHSIEVWIFATSYYFMHHAKDWGHLEGNLSGSFLDFVYYSFTSYTTLGTGDIIPFGDIRFLSGLESLTGLVLVTWTASFLYLEMIRYWNAD
jgi:hypothetical protein